MNDLNGADGGSKNIMRMVIDFMGTGKAFENKDRFYLVLGAATLGLAAVFGFILVIRAFIMVVSR